MPWREADDLLAWEDLHDATYDALWNAVYAMFDFRPSISSVDWPSFREPADAITWSIASIWDDFAANERRATAALLDALPTAMGDDTFVYALDWHHPGYRFFPQHARPAQHEGSWLVPALPNGDYYLFLAHDLRFGWITHPWEQTVCAFGDLVQPLRPIIDDYGWPLVREGGRPAPA